MPNPPMYPFVIEEVSNTSKTEFIHKQFTIYACSEADAIERFGAMRPSAIKSKDVSYRAFPLFQPVLTVAIQQAPPPSSKGRIWDNDAEDYIDVE